MTDPKSGEKDAIVGAMGSLGYSNSPGPQAAVMEEYKKQHPEAFKKGGKVSASSRADGCCVKGKTRGKMI